MKNYNMCIPLKRVSTRKKDFVKGVVFMMMIPRRKNEFDLFRDFFDGDDFFQLVEKVQL